MAKDLLQESLEWFKKKNGISKLVIDSLGLAYADFYDKWRLRRWLVRGDNDMPLFHEKSLQRDLREEEIWMNLLEKASKENVYAGMFDSGFFLEKGTSMEQLLVERDSAEGGTACLPNM